MFFQIAFSDQLIRFFATILLCLLTLGLIYLQIHPRITRKSLGIMALLVVLISGSLITIWPDDPIQLLDQTIPAAIWLAPPVLALLVRQIFSKTARSFERFIFVAWGVIAVLVTTAIQVILIGQMMVSEIRLHQELYARVLLSAGQMDDRAFRYCALQKLLCERQSPSYELAKQESAIQIETPHGTAFLPDSKQTGDPAELTLLLIHHGQEPWTVRDTKGIPATISLYKRYAYQWLTAVILAWGTAGLAVAADHRWRAFKRRSHDIDPEGLANLWPKPKMR